MWRSWRRQHPFLRGFVQMIISFLLVITIFSGFGLAILDLDIGPGEIKKVLTTETMSDCNRKYEEEVTTGRGPNEGYAVGIPKDGRKANNVKFDGYDETKGTLQDAKGFGYKVNKNGQWATGRTGQRMRTKLLLQAGRQKIAATLSGKKVEWILAEEKYLEAFQGIIDQADASDTITPRYQAPSAATKELCKKKNSSSGESSH